MKAASAESKGGQTKLVEEAGLFFVELELGAGDAGMCTGRREWICFSFSTHSCQPPTL